MSVSHEQALLAHDTTHLSAGSHSLTSNSLANSSDIHPQSDSHEQLDGDGHTTTLGNLSMISPFKSINFRNRMAPGFSSPSSIPVPKRSILNGLNGSIQSPNLPLQQKKRPSVAPSHPMSWMEDEELDEEWISEEDHRQGEDGEEEEEEEGGSGSDTIEEDEELAPGESGEDEEFGTTKLNEDKASTPEWKRAYNNKNNPKKNALEHMFRPPTIKQLDAIPEHSEHSTSQSSFQQSTKSSQQSPSEVSEQDQSLEKETHDESSRSYQTPSFESTTDQSLDASRKLSSSPLKVFQAHDTFTNSKYDGLLGSLDTRHSADASTASVVINSQKGQPARRDATTQDYMNDADALMNKLRGLHPSGSTVLVEKEEIVEEDEEEAEYTQDSNGYQASEINNNNNNNNGYEDDESSLRELEFSLKQHEPEPKPKARQQQPKRQRPALIQPQDVQGIIPERFGPMDFDRDNFIWRRKHDGSGSAANSGGEYGTGSTKVGSMDNSDKEEQDVFEGIEDLSDGSTLEGKVTSRQSSSVASPSPRKKRVDLEQFRESRIEHERRNAEQQQQQYPSPMRGSLDDEPSELRRSPYSPDQSSPSNGSTEVSDEDIENEHDYENQYEQAKSFQQEGGFAPFRTPHASHQPMQLVPSTSGGKREVSFRIPRSSIKSTPLTQLFSDLSTRGFLKDVTNISQIDTSYSHGYNNLVKVLTDMGRNDPAWDQYDHLDLSGRGLETLVKLDEICPLLKSVDLTDNEISFVTGAPESLRSMIAAKNQLTDLASFGKLVNLQYLSLAENRYERLNGLAGLCHLRELNVDSNFVASLDGISNLEGLLRVSCVGNSLKHVDFTCYNWRRLEELILDDNQIESVKGLEVLQSLTKLSMNKNRVNRIECAGRHKRLRKLCLQNNDLREFDTSQFYGLRELLLDNNPQLKLTGTEKLRNLDTLSMRYQSFSSSSTQDWSPYDEIKRLRFSGAVLSSLPIQEPFLNLQTLELCAVKLKTLPQHFSSLCINLRELDLSFNELSDLSPLVGVPKLKRLYVYRNAISDLSRLLDTISTFDSLKVLDTRANPLTARYYPQLVNPSAKRPYEEYVKTRSKRFQVSWALRDDEFAATLPRVLLNKRQKYQALLYGASTCNGTARLQWFDGIMLDKAKRLALGEQLQRIVDDK